MGHIDWTLVKCNRHEENLSKSLVSKLVTVGHIVRQKLRYSKTHQLEAEDQQVRNLQWPSNIPTPAAVANSARNDFVTG